MFNIYSYMFIKFLRNSFLRIFFFFFFYGLQLVGLYFINLFQECYARNINIDTCTLDVKL